MQRLSKYSARTLLNKVWFSWYRGNVSGSGSWGSWVISPVGFQFNSCVSIQGLHHSRGTRPSYFEGFFYITLHFITFRWGFYPKRLTISAFNHQMNPSIPKKRKLQQVDPSQPIPGFIALHWQTICRRGNGSGKWWNMQRLSIRLHLFKCWLRKSSVDQTISFWSGPPTLLSPTEFISTCGRRGCLFKVITLNDRDIFLWSCHREKESKIHVFLHLLSRKPPYLLIFIPGERLGRQDEPVVLGSSLHDTDVDGEPASADHLHMRVQQVTIQHTTYQRRHVDLQQANA